MSAVDRSTFKSVVPIPSKEKTEGKKKRVNKIPKIIGIQAKGSNSVKKVFDKSKLFMEDKGGVSIFLSRFLVTGIGASVNYISGLELYSLKRFAFFVVTGEILYSVELLFLGYFFKETFEEIANLFTNFSTLIILGFVLYIIWKNAFRMSPSDNS